MTMRSNGHIPGAGIDAPPERRPGIPMEIEPPKSVGAAHWQTPVPMDEALAKKYRPELACVTPVFGTAQPVSGLSGLIRRVAYKVSEHRVSRWMLLLLGDRVDVLEHTVLPRVLPIAAPIGAFALYRMLARPRRRGLARLFG